MMQSAATPRPQSAACEIEPPDDSIHHAVLALRDEARTRAAILEAWTARGWAAPADLRTRVLQTHYRPFNRARLLIEATFSHPERAGHQATQWLFAQVYADDRSASARLETAYQKRCLTCFGPPVFGLAHARAVVWALPNGPRLRPLKLLLRWKLFRQMLRDEEIVSPEFKLKGSRPRLLRYVPRRRAVARYSHPELGPRALFFKAYRPGEDTRALHNLMLLNGASCRAVLAFDVPEMVRHVIRRRTVVMGEVFWTPMTHVLASMDAESAGRVGRALASLHTAAIAPEGRWSAARECEAVRAAMADAVRALPALRERIGGVLRSLERGMHSQYFESSVPIHGNLFGDQILLDGPRVGIVDWDDLCLGDPLYDVGRLLAHCVFASPHVGMSTHAMAQVLGRLMAGYCACAERGGLDHPRLAWHVSAALLMRAKIAALRTLAPGWIASVERAVGEAERALAHPEQWLTEWGMEAIARRAGVHQGNPGE